MDLIQRFQQSITEYNKAKSLIDRGNIGEAEALLSNALSLYPREILMGSDPGLDGMVRESYETLFTDISVQLEVIKTLREDRLDTRPPAPQYDDETEEASEPRPGQSSVMSLQDIVRRNMKRGTVPPSTFDPPPAAARPAAVPDVSGRDLPRQISDEEEEVLIEETLKSEFSDAHLKDSAPDEPAEEKGAEDGFHIPASQMEHETPEEIVAELPHDPTLPAEEDDGGIGDLLNAAEQALTEEELSSDDDAPKSEYTYPAKDSAADETGDDDGDDLSADDLMDDMTAAGMDMETESGPVAPLPETAREAESPALQSKGDVELDNEEQTGDGIDEMLDAAEEILDDEVLGDDEGSMPAPTPFTPSGGGREEALDDDEALIPDEDLAKQKTEKKKPKKQRKKRSGAGIGAAVNFLLAVAALAALGGGGFLMFQAYTKENASSMAFAAAARAASDGNTADLAKLSGEYFKSAGGAASGVTSSAIASAWSQKLADAKQYDKAAAMLAEQLSRTPRSQAVAEQLIDVLIEQLSAAGDAGDTAVAEKTAMKISNLLSNYPVGPVRKQEYTRKVTETSCMIQQRAMVASIEAGDPAAAYERLAALDSMQGDMTPQEKQDMSAMKMNIARALEKKAAETLAAGDAKTAADLAAKALVLNPKSKTAAQTKKLADRKQK